MAARLALRERLWDDLQSHAGFHERNRSKPSQERWPAMTLTINGDTRWFEELRDLAALVSALGLDGRKVAIERNLEIVPRSAYGRTRLADGDRIEIVHFIGGG